MPAYRDKPTWYLGLSAYWFATSFKWFILLLVVIPGQVEKLVPGGEKGGYWGMVFAIGAAWAMIGPSLFGFISDRLMARWRNRRPFLAIGAALTAIALMSLAGANSITAIVFGYLLLQVSDDVGTGPYAALIPELVPVERRGRASGFMGLMSLLGQLTVGVMAIVLHGDIFKIYVAIAVVNILCAIWSIMTISGAEPVETVDYAEKVSANPIKDFIQGWAAPWRSRDFFWVWFTRFLNAFGFYLIVNYLRYFLTDVVKVFDLGFVKFGDAGMAANVLALVISLTGAFGSIWASRAADRLGRKRVIYIAGTLMSITLIPFILFPTYVVIFSLATVFGVGYGLYMSADWALASDVMPSKGDEGKDMGVWSMSNTAVQIFTGLMGALIDAINRSFKGGGYTTAFAIAAVMFFMSTVLVRQVKGST